MNDDPTPSAPQGAGDAESARRHAARRGAALLTRPPIRGRTPAGRGPRRDRREPSRHAGAAGDRWSAAYGRARAGADAAPGGPTGAWGAAAPIDAAGPAYDRTGPAPAGPTAAPPRARPGVGGRRHRVAPVGRPRLGWHGRGPQRHGRVRRSRRPRPRSGLDAADRQPAAGHHRRVVRGHRRRRQGRPVRRQDHDDDQAPATTTRSARTCRARASARASSTTPTAGS